MLAAALIIAAVPLTGCVGVSREPDRVTVADYDWGVDTVFDENHRPRKVYIEGPQGVTLPGTWELNTGRTDEDRQYILLERVADPGGAP
jgi:hypothetical protein